MLITTALTTTALVITLSIYCIGVGITFLLGCLDPEGRSLGWKPLVWPYLLIKSLLTGE
jgi:alpha-tubulin suppressor-like RCC1 family protein